MTVSGSNRPACDAKEYSSNRRMGLAEPEFYKLLQVNSGWVWVVAGLEFIERHLVEIRPISGAVL